MKNLAIILINLYQKTSILRSKRCRFYPTCSHYTKQSIEKHGLMKGFVLGCIRLLKCNPFHNGGVDEVPNDFSLGLINRKFKQWT